MLRFLQKIALNPYFQAFVVAGMIIIFAPMGINKYRCEQVEISTNFDGSQIIFSDLDHDGVSEKILTFFNLSGNGGLAVLKGSLVLGQWNFKGVYESLSPRIIIGDYDHDDLDEIYAFTQYKDTIFLHAWTILPEPSLFIENHFIARLGQNLQDPDYLIHPGTVTDMNGDGRGELVFTINAGHSRQPRNVFVYDITRDSLIQSPKSGAFIGSMIMENLDADPFPEFILSSFAASNYNDEPFIYTDTSSWLMVLDHDLRFMFPPLEFPGPAGGLSVAPVETGAGLKQVIAMAAYGSPFPVKRMLFMADTQGHITKRKDMTIEDPLSAISMNPPPAGYPKNMALGISFDNGFFSLDSNLTIKKISDVKYANWDPIFLDIDLDGKDEIIVLAPDHEKHMIYRNDFSHPTELDLPIQSANLMISVKLNGPHPPQLSAQGDQRWKLFEYKTNLIYRLRFLVWLGIYLAVLSFILGIRKLYGIQLKRRYETEKQMTRLQLTGIKAQMEPHFIMNTINMIGSSIYRQKAEEAYQQLLKFSGMVRSLLTSSDKLTRSLAEELDFVDNYLQLEKSRFAGQFDFSIRRLDEEEEEKRIIPKMIVQIHAENALKHGLLPKKEGGLLEIAVEKGGDYLEISVRDNGIGRHAAAHRRSESTGKGMKIIDQLFETYNKHNRIPLRQEITDLYDASGQPTGTLVQIFVPLEFNAEIY